MDRIKLTLYFGAKQHGAFGDFADTVQCEVPPEKVGEITTALTTQQWVSIGLPNGKRMVNTANLRWFDIEVVKEASEEEPKKNAFEELFSSVFPKGDKNA